MLCLTLPTELTDAIIDYLYDDRCALAQCSAVCKAWLARSRHHHFKHVFLSYKNRSRISAFMDLFNSPHSTIAPHILSLRLVDGRPPHQRWLADNFTSLTMLGAVQSLTIENPTFAHLDSSVMTRFLRGFTMLKELRLLRVYHKSFSQLVDIVGACPFLEHFSLDDVRYWNKVPGYSYPSIDQQPMHRLVDLELGDCDKVAVISWFLAGQNAPALTKFRATSLARDQIPYTGALLRALIPSLEHLELGLGTDGLHHGDTATFMSMYYLLIGTQSAAPYYPSPIGNHIDLSGHVHLRTIHFTGYTYPQLESSVNTLWIPTILSNVTPSPIEELVFCFLAHSSRDFEHYNWTALTDILVETPFPRLRTIRFYVECLDVDSQTRVRLHPTEWTNMIRHKLHTWDALGVLHV
jgi:hypothetical protein